MGTKAQQILVSASPATQPICFKNKKTHLNRCNVFLQCLILTGAILVLLNTLWSSSKQETRLQTQKKVAAHFYLPAHAEPYPVDRHVLRPRCSRLQSSTLQQLSSE